MLKIGEFSRLTHVSVRMLHYYDNAGLLKPALTDPATGYRYYSVSQGPALQKIVLLRDLDFQVAEIMESSIIPIFPCWTGHRPSGAACGNL